MVFILWTSGADFSILGFFSETSYLIALNALISVDFIVCVYICDVYIWQLIMYREVFLQ